MTVGRSPCFKCTRDCRNRRRYCLWSQRAAPLLAHWIKDHQLSTNERDLIVGGQAVIEGVMMRTPNAYAIAVRKADGTIVNIAARLPKWSDKYPLLKLPVLRGSAVLVQSMGLGIKALNFSANEAFADAQEAEVEEVEFALTPAVVEGEGDFAGITGGVPGLFPMPTQQRASDE